MINSRWLPRRQTARFLAVACSTLLLTRVTAGAAVAQGAVSGPRVAFGDRPWLGSGTAPTSTAMAMGTRQASTETPAPRRLLRRLHRDEARQLGLPMEGCQRARSDLVSSVNEQATADYNYEHGSIGVGTGVYWFMGGPGVDPHYNGTAAEAYDWGEQQAGYTLGRREDLVRDLPGGLHGRRDCPSDSTGTTRPSPTTAGTTVYTSRVQRQGEDRAASRPRWTGPRSTAIAAYITHHSSYKVGIYSAPVDLDRHLRDRQHGDAHQHLRVDLHRLHQQLVAHSAGLVPARHHDLRAVLRRDPSSASVRAGVAVVGRRLGFGGYGDFDQIDKNRLS